MTPPGRPGPAGLRARLYRGASWLGTREVVGIAIRTLGLVVTLRLLGPAAYGEYAGALAVVTLLSLLAQGGIENYLNSGEEPFDDVAFDRASTFLLCTSAAAVAGGFALSVLARGPLSAGASVPVLQVLLLTVPVNVLWAPAQARLDKAFRFRAVAWLELGGDLVLYATSVALVLAGLGVWGLVAGYAAWQSWLLVGSHVLVRRVPRLDWAPAAQREMLGFGLPFASAQGLAQAEAVVNPLVVGPIAGTAGVGTVAFAIRVLDTFSFVTRAALRLAVMGFAATQREAARLRRGLEEAMLVQVLVLGALLAGVTLALEVLLTPVFGAEWERASDVFGFLALSYLLGAAFSAQAVYLQVLGRSWRVAQMHLVKLVLLGVSALVLVPELGAPGYGAAAALSCLAYWLVHRAVRATVPYEAASAGLWLAALAPLVFVASVPMPWALATLVPLALVASTRAAREPLLGLLARAREGS